MQNYNKYRQALQELGIIVFPVKGTTVADYKLGKAPYTNQKFNRFSSFYSYKERPFTEEEMEYYFSIEKTGEIGLGILFGEVVGRENTFLVGLDIDEMVEGDVNDFKNYCIDRGLAVVISASKKVHVYGYSNTPFPDIAVSIDIGGFKVRGDLWGNGGKYFVAPPTKITGGEYVATESFINALFIDRDFSFYPSDFIEAFVGVSKNNAEKIKQIQLVPVSSIDVEGFVKAYSTTPILKNERHATLLSIAKEIHKRIYNNFTQDKAISLVTEVLKGLKNNGTIENGEDKSDQELTDIASYTYGYRKHYEDSLKTPEFKKIVETYRETGELPKSLDDYRKTYIKRKVLRHFDYKKHSDCISELKRLRDSLYTLEGTALRQTKEKMAMLREYIYNNAFHRILSDKPNLKYDALGNRFYDYSDGVYIEQEVKVLESEIIDCLTSYGLDVYATRNKAQDVIARMIKYTPTFKLSSIKNLTCVGNGILNIDTLELRPHTPDFVTLTKITTNYNPNAVVEGSRWEKFIDEINCGEEGQVRLLKQFTGYLLTPSTMYQKCLIMTGEGSNGKGTYTKMLRTLVGDKAYSAMKAEELNRPFSLSNLVGKRVNICDESSGKYLDSHILKSLISGEEQSSDVKHKNQILFTPEVKIIMTVNDLPAISDTSYGFYRRIIQMEMGATFSAENGNLDSNLIEKLMSEKEIMFKWAVDGYQDLKDQGGFTLEEVNKNLVASYREDNDIIHRFVENMFIETEGGYQTLMEVYQVYRQYVVGSGKTPKAVNNFTKDLLRLPVYGKLFTYEKRMHGHDTAKIMGVVLKSPAYLKEFDGLY